MPTSYKWFHNNVSSENGFFHANLTARFSLITVIYQIAATVIKLLKSRVLLLTQQLLYCTNKKVLTKNASSILPIILGLNSTL